MNKEDFWKKDLEICMEVCKCGEHENSVPMNPSITMTSCFGFASYADLSAAIKQERGNCVYSRGTNPTVRVLEQKLARLEQGEECKCFASGMGAISAALYAILEAGDHVVVVNNIYGPVLQYLTHSRKNNISFEHLADDVSVEAVEQAILPNTKLIYFESPATMTFRQVDMEKICNIAKSRNILTMIDNTWATPLFQKPILFGVDLVVHSLTKYIGGASDLVGGALITSCALMDRIFPVGFLLQGAVMSPFVGYLCLRGLLSLPLRMKQHEQSAMTVANFLAQEDKILSTNHPALRKEDADLTQKQLMGHSGLFSFDLDTQDFEKISQFIDNLQHFKKAVSWGGFESLAISPHFGVYDPVKNKGVSKGIIRISVGLEPVETLIEDLRLALSKF
ncbi:MAG: trans-sulfuration enzyme family protein [Spirochaetia bacterium]